MNWSSSVAEMKVVLFSSNFLGTFCTRFWSYSHFLFSVFVTESSFLLGYKQAHNFKICSFFSFLMFFLLIPMLSGIAYGHRVCCYLPRHGITSYIHF